MNSCDLLFFDTYGLQNRFTIYLTNIQAACFSVTESISQLSKDHTLSGLWATSAKAYFNEVHRPLSNAFVSLLTCTAIKYSEYFLGRLQDAPLSEKRYSARLNTDDMDSKSQKLQDLTNGLLSEAQSFLSAARDNAVFRKGFEEFEDIKSAVNEVRESKYLLTIGSAHSGVRGLKKYVDDTRNAVVNIDNEASTKLKNDQEISDLKEEIRKTLDFCKASGKSSSGYVPGSFNSSALIQATENCNEKIRQNIDAFLDSNRASIDLSKEKREADQIDVANWSIADAVAGTIGLVCGLIGFVGTAAATEGLSALAFLGVGGTGLTFQAYDTANRGLSAREEYDKIEEKGKKVHQSVDVSTEQVEIAALNNITSSNFADKSKFKVGRNLGRTATSIALTYGAQNDDVDNETLLTFVDSVDAAEGIGTMVKKGASSASKVVGGASVGGVVTDAITVQVHKKLEESRNEVRLSEQYLDHEDVQASMEKGRERIWG